MTINKYCFCLWVFVLFYPLLLNGQDFLVTEKLNNVSISEIHIDNEKVSPLFDSIVDNWNSSPFKDIYSYAVVIPHITYNKQLVWRVRIEQLYDFDVYAMMFIPGFSFIRTYIPFGTLQYNHHTFFVGAEKHDFHKTSKKDSQEIVDLCFSEKANNITFYRDSIEKRISTSEYIHQIDTIGGTSAWDWEMYIDKKYDAMIIEYLESDNGFICLKKEIIKVP